MLSTQKFNVADGDGDEEITLDEYRQLFLKKQNLSVYWLCIGTIPGH
jgi:hypothetical protein